MKISRGIFILLLTSCILSVIFAFRNNNQNKQLAENIKYEYAIVHVLIDEYQSNALLYIKYSNGKVEDYKLNNHISYDSIANHLDKCTISAFQYLNQQNYELRSSNMNFFVTNTHKETTKEFYFYRKTSE